MVCYFLPAARTDEDIAVQPGSSITLLGKLISGTMMLVRCPFEQSGHVFDDDDDDDAELNRMRYSLDWKEEVDRIDLDRAVFQRQCKVFVVMRFSNAVYDKVQGLVLMPCDERRPDGGDRYRRVGCFSIEMGSQWIDGLLDQEVVIS